MLLPATVVAHGWIGGAPFWPFFIIGPLFWLAIVVLIVTLIVRRRRHGGAPHWAGPIDGQAYWSGRQGQWGQSGGYSVKSAEHTLAERFANGDIDEVEYRARLEVLRANRADSV